MFSVEEGGGGGRKEGRMDVAREGEACFKGVHMAEPAERNPSRVQVNE
jgi:hypothetical protein